MRRSCDFRLFKNVLEYRCGSKLFLYDEKFIGPIDEMFKIKIKTLFTTFLLNIERPNLTPFSVKNGFLKSLFKLMEDLKRKISSFRKLTISNDFELALQKT